MSEVAIIAPQTATNVARVVLSALLALTTLGCPVPDPPGVDGAAAESWQCRNDLEISCVDGACEAAADDGFTAMSVSADGAGRLDVCAYSGCWEGIATVTRSEPAFVVWIGRDFEFSTTRGPSRPTEDLLFAIHRRDGVALLKVAEFAQPLICKSG